MIELLIAIAIVVMLAGMLTSLLGIAKRKSKDTATRATLMKVDQAVRLFRIDAGAYPFQTDLSTADADPTKWTNNLAFRLAWKPELDDGHTDPSFAAANRTAYRDKIQADLTAITACFKFVSGKNIGSAGGDGTHAFRFGDYYYPADPTYLTNLLMREGSLSIPDADFATVNGPATSFIIAGWDITSGGGLAFVLTKMAEEISKIRYLSGQLPVLAPQGMDPADPADKLLRPNFDPRYTMVQMWSAFIGYSYQPATGTNWTAYRFVPYNKRGPIGDDSRGPVLTTAAAQGKGWRGEYLSDVLKVQTSANSPGDIDPTGTIILDSYRNPLVYVCPFTPGARGYKFGLGGIAPDERDYGMAPVTRTVTAVLASDIRTTAGATFTTEFELWSAGPDGGFKELRNDPANRDNVAIPPYNKGLQ